VIPVEREALSWALRRRLTWAMFAMLAVFALFLLRSWFLQVLSHDKYSALAQSNRVRTVVEKPERGLVFDRYGRPLVDNVPSFNLALVLDDVADLSATVEQVAGLLGLEPDPILEVARRQRSAIPYLPVTVRKNLTLRQVADVEWAHIPGVVVLAETERHHIYGEMAAHLLGYVGEITERQLADPAYAGVLPGTRVGQYGVERSFDRQLRGVPGRRRIEVDAKGFEVRELGREPPTLGNDLYLTIDVEVQKAAEEALGDRRGAVVALDPKSGEVLALVSRPAFDAEAISRGISPEDWRRITADPGRPLLNRVVQGAYPPGSIFKVAVASAIMETLPQPYTYFCTGQHPFMGRTYRDWKIQGHGRIDLFRAIVESCDVFFYEYGDRLGIDTIADYASRFGFGARTGIDLAGENSGTLPSTQWKEETKGEIWYPGETLSAAIGQGYVTATPLQIAAFMAAVANDGKRFVPSVRLGLWDHATDRLIADVPRALPPAAVSPGTIRTLQTALKAVVGSRHGTGTAARSRVTTIAGKTGTAQVVALADDTLRRPDLEDVPVRLRDHAWFAAYAPTDDPQIAVAVLVEHGGHGGGVAGPVARQVIEAFMAAEKNRPGRGTLPEYLASLRTTAGGYAP
jgi:penicillin-binding protein 2